MSGAAPAPAERRVATGAPDASGVPPATVQAYLETEYRVDCQTAGMPPLVLHVDCPSPALRALHAAQGVTSSVFLTACNPLGRLCDAACNQRRQDELAAALQRLGFAAIDGIGQHPSNGWPGEPSFLVPGPDYGTAIRLGLRYEQNAVIWCGADAVPRLLLLR